MRMRIAATLLLLIAFAPATEARAEGGTCMTSAEYAEIWDRFGAAETAAQNYYRHIARQRADAYYRRTVYGSRIRRNEAKLRETYEALDAQEGQQDVTLMERARIVDEGLVELDRDLATAAEDHREALVRLDELTHIRRGWTEILSVRPNRTDILYAMRRVALNIRRAVGTRSSLVQTALTRALSYSYTHMVQAGPQAGCPAVASHSPVPEAFRRRPRPVTEDEDVMPEPAEEAPHTPPLVAEGEGAAAAAEDDAG